MKKWFKGNCSATGIGSLPHATAKDALKVTKEELVTRMHDIFNDLHERADIDPSVIAEHSLITPACGMGGYRGMVPLAERVVRLTKEISDDLQAEYGLRE